MHCVYVDMHSIVGGRVAASTFDMQESVIASGYPSDVRSATLSDSENRDALVFPVSGLRRISPPNLSFRNRRFPGNV